MRKKYFPTLEARVFTLNTVACSGQGSGRGRLFLLPIGKIVSVEVGHGVVTGTGVHSGYDSVQQSAERLYTYTPPIVGESSHQGID